MNIGWVGLGKLGLPCATVLAQHHFVCGTDLNPAVQNYLQEPNLIPYQEAGLRELLETGQKPQWAGSIEDVVLMSDVIFVAVQTPHAPEFEGDQPMTQRRADFDYSYLVEAVREIAAVANARSKEITLVVVSTVLPGTMSRLIEPITDMAPITLIYSPSFIAMGTAVADFENPELVLVGSRSTADAYVLRDVVSVIHKAPVVAVSIPSAELAKVAYNTYIGQKIVFANTIMEICHKTAADADEVHAALSKATRRLHSPAYLGGGMGDGGGCHPRDNIALSWLAQRLDLSVDWFTAIMAAREQQTGWIADLAQHHAKVARLPICILGKAYKAGSNLTVGSPASLLAFQLDDEPARVLWHWDPFVDNAESPMPEKAVYVVATNHNDFNHYPYPWGSVVIDPWGYIDHQPGVTVIQVGRK